MHPSGPDGSDRFAIIAGTVLLSFVATTLVALGGRLIYIQVADGARLTLRAARQQRGVSPLAARRGSIFDARGRCVARTRIMREVFVDARRVANVDDLATRLGAVLNREPGAIAERVRAHEGSRYIRIADHVEEDVAESVRGLKCPGVGVSEHPVRVYPLASSMAHVLGIVGRDGVGLESLELQYDDHLRGRDGVSRTVRDAARRPIGWGEGGGGGGLEPIDGGDVVLTLDCEIQRIVEEQLDGVRDRFDAEYAVGIVMDPWTGDVLALAVRPAFDPNQYDRFSADARRNRALTDPVEPGSVFKPFVASAALAAGVVTTDERIDCHQGVFRFGGRTLHDTHPQGRLDLKGIIVHSSNIGMGIIGTRLGNAALERIVRRFGFGAPTGIDLPGDSAGVVIPLRRWTGYSATSVPMGQELAITPIQLVCAFSSLANGGLLLKPRVVRRLRAPDGRVVASFGGPTVVRRVLTESVARLFARTVLPGVVEEVGGGNLRPRDYTMLAKTGTAQMPYRDRRGYEPNMYLSSTIAAAPVGTPRVVVLVMASRPDRARGYYGRVVAGPAVRAIVDQSLRYLGVPPDRHSP